MSVKANLVRIRSSDLDSEPEPRQDFGSGKFSKFNGDIVVRRYISGNIFIHVQVVHEKQQECRTPNFLSFTRLCATADGKLLQCTLVGLKLWPF